MSVSSLCSRCSLRCFTCVSGNGLSVSIEVTGCSVIGVIVSIPVTRKSSASLSVMIGRCVDLLMRSASGLAWVEIWWI